MKITKRLGQAAELVSPGSGVLDVGCDHGLTCIYLIESGRSPFAVGSDLREGPIRKAEENFKAFGVEGRAKAVRADGVPKGAAGLFPDGLPLAVVMTGMGGLLISRILREAEEELRPFGELVLGPQSDADAVRRTLRELGFFIADERMLVDAGKFYVLIKAERGFAEATELKEREFLQELEDRFGPILLSRGGEVFSAYLEKEEKRLSSILEGMEEGQRGYAENIEELEGVRAAMAAAGRQR